MAHHDPDVLDSFMFRCIYVSTDDTAHVQKSMNSGDHIVTVQDMISSSAYDCTSQDCSSKTQKSVRW